MLAVLAVLAVHEEHEAQMKGSPFPSLEVTGRDVRQRVRAEGLSPSA